jgi:16S rRNA (cytosine1402-N4)-methyltransferase
MGSLPVDEMEGPYSARLPSSSIGEKSRRAPVGRETADVRVCLVNETAEFSHTPVMLTEILEVFAPVTDGIVVDATVGGGGHAGALLDAHQAIGLVGLDQDPAALEASARSLARHGDRVTLRRARFDSLAAELDALGITTIAGVLFDLGVSSHQLDEGERGFSFRSDGPLDMRMDPDSSPSAAELVDELDEGALARLLSDLGDERHARRIARAIIDSRPIETTARLAEIVATAMPAASRRSPGHPARRTFQALRIAVNSELDVLEPALSQAIARLGPGGRGAVLSYHSGEDRIVKRVLRSAAGLDRVVPRGLPEPVDSEGPAIRLLHRGGRTPSEAEIEANPRAKAARLRSFERLDDGGGGR